MLKMGMSLSPGREQLSAARSSASPGAWLKKQGTGTSAKLLQLNCAPGVTGAVLGSSTRLLLAAWTPSRSEFWVLKVLGNNCLDQIFQIIVMYLQVLEVT